MLKQGFFQSLDNHVDARCILERKANQQRTVGPIGGDLGCDERVQSKDMLIERAMPTG